MKRMKTPKAMIVLICKAVRSPLEPGGLLVETVGDPYRLIRSIQ